MKKLTKLPLLFFASLLFSSAAFAQSSSTLERRMYKAYLTNSKPLWKLSVEQAAEKAKENPGRENQYQLALARFGLLNATMASQDEDLFYAYYDETVDQLKSLQKRHKDWAEPVALLSAVYGLKIAYSPLQGMFLGPTSSKLISKAQKLNPGSPLVWKIYGTSKQHTPEMWGGNLNEAIESYEKALQLYERTPEELAWNWRYLDTLAWLGKAYQDKGEVSRAIALYKKALQLSPDFAWVKHRLLPQALAAK